MHHLRLPGKATAVATRTIGFTAGAASMNATAAAAARPGSSRPATGTEAHSPRQRRARQGRAGHGQQRRLQHPLQHRRQTPAP